ncbi:secreted subtilisin-like serine protease, putative [Babesia ovata]|uniref:Secreted subtilisin-like serine protease, putative n=1 Tax=Babesia ovata TaxID=189622 RepID=A0A2H6K7L1_9APIC|nr:secreted subtilisin-like serine protease, putative [Babesia ovata]GBE58939.1 secreted subtilisin-like serine protease, putative [Babesia ovata]
MSSQKEVGHVEVTAPLRYELSQQTHSATGVDLLRDGANSRRGLAERGATNLTGITEGRRHTRCRWSAKLSDAARERCAGTGAEGRRAGSVQRCRATGAENRSCGGSGRRRKTE